MKRASLKVVPAAAPQAPTDLTDRLLDREAERPPAPAPAKKRASPPAKRPAQPAPANEPPAPPTVNTAAAPAPAAEQSNDALTGALGQAQAASLALEAAAQAAPARYSVALRYRLEALALHLRQVADFVQRLNQK